MLRTHARYASGVLATVSFRRSMLLASVAAVLATQPVRAQDVETSNEAPDVIVVRGQFIPDERRDTAEISSVVDSEDFSLQGDGDAAVALRRISGLSLSADSKFIFARGLNERYTTATLNGSPLPSPEPLRRTVPLDLFPTSVLASVLAQKTYSPQYSGEFGGAVIDLRTKAVPDERFIEFGLSAGLNDETFLQDGLLYHGGGDSDYTGFDDGTRNTTDEINLYFGDTRIDNVDTADNIAAGLSLIDPALWVLQSGDVAGDFGMKLSAGERFDLPGRNVSIGILAAAGYGSEWRTRHGEQAAAAVAIAAGGGEPQEFLRQRVSTQHDVTSNGLLSVGFDILDNHEIQGLVMGLRSTQKEARSTFGPDPDDRSHNEEDYTRIDTTEWFERQVWTSQIQGSHFFPSFGDLELNWRASYSEALRDAPFQTKVPYLVSSTSASGFIIDPSPSVVDVDFSTVADDTTDFGIDLKLPLTVAGRSIELMGGYAYQENDREALTRSFFYRVGAGLDQRIDVALGQLAGGNAVVFGETPADLVPDFHVATLEVDAFYVGLDAELTDFLRVSIGARYEDAIEAVQTRDTTETAEQTAASPILNVPNRDNCFSQGDQFTCAIEKDPILPAASLTWNFTDNMQLRLAYSQTIIRPQFREYAPGEFTDTETNQVVIGNPFLINTRLKNLDARWEYYFARDQFVTLGLFYKDLTNPIEEALLPVGNQFQTTFVNIPSAEIFGAEAEFERIFELAEAPVLGNFGFFDSKDAIVRMNYTFTQSEISTDGTSIRASRTVVPSPLAVPQGIFEDGRPLQGTSEHLLNVTLGYQDFDAQSRAALVFNFSSERIRSSEASQGAGAAASIIPVVFEQPPMSLDLTYSRLFDLRGAEFELGFQAKNLLNSDYDAYQKVGDREFTFDRYDIGRTFGISLSVRR